jgi:4-amino-4-deoxy-L-arabinose transferase-like glycosyltransferase
MNAEFRGSVSGSFPDAFCILILCAAAVSFQLFAGAYHTDLAQHTDESAQFITGLMLFDYVTTELGSNPRAFAENYYLHYPKVAFGHWPPLFFLAEAAGFWLFGPSKASALILVELTTLVMVLCLYRRLRRINGSYLSLLTGLCLLALPMVRKFSSVVLSDMMTASLMTLAVFSFTDFVISGKLRDSLWFGIWSSLALLTKGNAAALAFLPPLAVLMTGRLSLLRSWKFWFSAVLVVATCAPWYLFTMRLALNVSGSGGHLSGNYVHYNIERLPSLFQYLGLGILSIAALGTAGAFRPGPLS